MTKNYKILTSYVKDISSKINDTESYIYLKDNVPKYSLGIDINSIPLKNNMAEVNIKLNFSNKSEIDQKAYFEMTHSTVVRVDETAVNKDDLKKIFFCTFIKIFVIRFFCSFHFRHFVREAVRNIIFIARSLT